MSMVSYFLRYLSLLLDESKLEDPLVRKLSNLDDCIYVDSKYFATHHVAFVYI